MTATPWHAHEYETLQTLGVLGDGVWDDMRAPATSINPAGAVNGAGVDTDDGCLVFDNSTAETCAVVMQMPHAWKEGSTIRPHVHWTKTTSAAGKVMWRLEYQVANFGAAFSGVWTKLADVTDPVADTPDNNTANEHLISTFGDMTMTNMLISCMIKFRLTRVATDPLDNYGADAKLLEFDVHYQLDSAGSIEQFTKQTKPRSE